MVVTFHLGRLLEELAPGFLWLWHSGFLREEFFDVAD
jgi:hypothetical protein